MLAPRTAHRQDKRLNREAIVEKMFSLTDTMGPYEPSTMIDLLKGRPLEVTVVSLFCELVLLSTH